MVEKKHITLLPDFKIDTSYPRNSEDVALSIPIFHTPRGWVGNFDAYKNFDLGLFKDVICRGAAWVAHSLQTNTDLCKNGMPIYFHVEDTIFDVASDVLASFDVPEEWIRKTSFEEPDNPEILHPRYGKKLACFTDSGIQTKVMMMWDADSFVYRPLGEPIFEWYHHFQEGGKLATTMGASFYADWNGGDESFVNWIRLAAGLGNIQGGITPERIKHAECEAYERLGLALPKTQYRWGAAMFSLPREHAFAKFIDENIICNSYADEGLLAAWMNAVGSEFVDLIKLWDMPFIRSGKEFAEHKTQCFAHPWSDEVPVVKYAARLAKGVDGRNREKINATPRKRKRIIVFGVPHTPSSNLYQFPHCAFAQKARKLCSMMHRRGHEVIYFGNELCDVECTEHVVVTTESDLADHHPDYKTKANVTKHGTDYHIYKKFYMEAEHHYRKRTMPDDLLCYVIGWQMRPLYDALQDLPVHHVESGIGYYSAYMKYKVFESAAVRDFTYGGYEKNYHAWNALSDEQKAERYVDWNTTVHHSNPQWQDTIIPNSFFPEEFKYNDTPGGDYFLYIGRVMRGKGIEEAMRIADAVGKKLIVAGTGDFKQQMGFDPWNCVEIIGEVGVKERTDLLYNAALVFCISHYPEPFGGTIIESGLSGRPVMTSNFGAHWTNVKHKVTGFRMWDFDDGVRYARNLDIINPADCRAWAMRYANENVAKLYDEYFDRVLRYANNQQSIYWVTDPEIDIAISQLPAEERKAALDGCIERFRGIIFT